MAITPEAKTTAEIKKLLESWGWSLIRQHSGRFHRRMTVGRVGDPDWMVYRRLPSKCFATFSDDTAPRYVMFWMEVKAPAGKPSPEQINRMAELARAGHIVEWFDGCFADDPGCKRPFLPWYQSVRWAAVQRAGKDSCHRLQQPG